LRVLRGTQTYCGAHILTSEEGTIREVQQCNQTVLQHVNGSRQFKIT
jgi:hypothetical protein